MFSLKSAMAPLGLAIALPLVCLAQNTVAELPGNWPIRTPKWTQETKTSGLTGTVEDPTGAVIPNAAVTLTGKTNGQVKKVVADAAGGFSISDVPAGDYILKAKAEGFESAERELKVGAGPMAPIQLQLRIAAKGEEVNVSGKSRDEEDRITLDRNADRLTLDEDLLKSLPSNADNILGVAGNFVSPGAFGGEGLTISVDGVESGGLSLPANSIKRLRINRNPYSAEFRRPGKARIEAQTDEGSLRRFRGRFAMYARNSAFDARNAFARTRPDLDRKLFEANLSGPILAKRMAFLISGERLLNDESAIINARTLAGPVVSNVVTPERRTGFLARLEYRPRDSHTLSLLYNYRDQLESNRGIGGLRLAEQAINTRQRINRLQFTDRLVLSPRLLNEFRVVAQRENLIRGMAGASPAIVVIGAFTGGPAATFRKVDETSVRIVDIASYVAGGHSLKFGGEFRPNRIAATDQSNFAGTFEFSSLDQFASQRPFVYRINRGLPQVLFSQNEVAGFIQDDWKLRRNLNVVFGARYQWQQNLEDRNNIAPRLSVAYQPGGDQKTVIRAGIGMFYERVAEEVTQRARLYDGARIRETVIANPSFPIASQPAGSQPPPSIVRVAPNLRAPYLWQAGVSVERELRKGTQLTVEYQALNGRKLLRSRNINAPLPSTGLRFDPAFLNINQVESSAASRGHSLGLTVRTQIGKRLQAMAQYVYSRNRNDTSGLFSLPANNFDLRPEWGRADFDQRHRFNLTGTAMLPADFQIGTIVSFGSSLPYDITTGFDDNRDSVANDRPAGGTRNLGRGPNLARVDLRLTRAFRIPRLLDRGRDSTSNNLEFSIDIFNLFNRVNFNNFIGAQSSPFFGRAAAAAEARALQFSSRYKF